MQIFFPNVTYSPRVVVFECALFLVSQDRILGKNESVVNESYLIFSCLVTSFISNQVKFNGMTGSVQFDDSGKRTDVTLEILNLQNGSFQKVR